MRDNTKLSRHDLYALAAKYLALQTYDWRNSVYLRVSSEGLIVWDTASDQLVRNAWQDRQASLAHVAQELGIKESYAARRLIDLGLASNTADVRKRFGTNKAKRETNSLPARQWTLTLQDSDGNVYHVSVHDSPTAALRVLNTFLPEPTDEIDNSLHSKWFITRASDRMSSSTIISKGEFAQPTGSATLQSSSKAFEEIDTSWRKFREFSSLFDVPIENCTSCTPLDSNTAPIDPFTRIDEKGSVQLIFRCIRGHYTIYLIPQEYSDILFPFLPISSATDSREGFLTGVIFDLTSDPRIDEEEQQYEDWRFEEAEYESRVEYDYAMEQMMPEYFDDVRKEDPSWLGPVDTDEQTSEELFDERSYRSYLYPD